MMDAELSSADVKQNKNGGSDDKLLLHSSKTQDLQAAVRADSIAAGASTEVISFSEQISTEETDLSSAGISVDANKTAGVRTRVVSTCSPGYMDMDQLKPQCVLLPPSVDPSTVYEVSQSVTSMSRSQAKHQTTHVHTEPEREDICAAVLLACLFCHPLDCLLATVRGCNECVWWLCSSLCGCQPAALQPALDATVHGELCCCLNVRSCLCDCTACDICLPATECLELAMEISQMLYH